MSVLPLPATQNSRSPTLDDLALAPPPVPVRAEKLGAERTGTCTRRPAGIGQLRRVQRGRRSRAATRPARVRSRSGRNGERSCVGRTEWKTSDRSSGTAAVSSTRADRASVRSASSRRGNAARPRRRGPPGEAAQLDAFSRRSLQVHAAIHAGDAAARRARDAATWRCVLLADHVTDVVGMHAELEDTRRRRRTISTATSSG